MSSQAAPVLPPVTITQEAIAPEVQTTPAVEPVVAPNDTTPKPEEIKEAATEATTEPATETVTETAAEPVTETAAPAATTEEVPAASREVHKELPAVPSPSKSASNRLSLFINKAKRSLSGHVDKPAEEKVEPVPTPVAAPPAVEAHVDEPAAIEPTVESHVDEPASVPAAAEEEHAEVSAPNDKTEKRKSRFLGGIFNRSKSPVKHEEHTALEHESPGSTESQPAVPEDPPVATPPTEAKEVAVEEPKATPVEETSALAPTAAVETEEEEVPAKDSHKEVNVLDQIKRNSFVTKLFGKKKETDKPVKHEEPVVTESTEPASEEPVSPVLETSTTEPKPVEEEAPAKEEESVKPPSRPSSPLSRRLTQMLRFPKKDKKEKKDRAVAPLSEESAEAAVAPEVAAETTEAAAVEGLAIEAAVETPIADAAKSDKKETEGEEAAAPLASTTTAPVQAVA
ncbi:hypothetical protein CLU79DRAFT_776358 [Phycomyces nitens]|nr:hypothetical protein CLU79DRAFT_776358 [Phycomyces nitens]